MTIGTLTRRVVLFDAAGNEITTTTSGSEQLVNVAIYDASGNQITSFGGGGGVDPVGLKDSSGNQINATQEGVGYALDAHITNDTIEQTTGVAHTDKSVAVAGKDGSGNVRPFNVDATTRDLQVDVTNTVTVSGTVSVSEPVSVDDNGGSLTVDGTVAATQSGTWNVTNVSGTVSLPTGAATSANQLPDGHNVTVDNAAGASAVNVQDGGNSITVDDGGSSLTVDGTVGVTGTVAATQSGTWNINNVSGTVSLPTGAATAANQLPDGHNVTIDNAAGASAVNIQDGGNVISVDDAGGSITVDGTVAVAGIVAASQSGTWNINDISGTISLPTGAATETTLSLMEARMAGSLVPDAFDYIDLGYDGSNRLNSVVYKTGGAAGSTVATLAITYVGATTDIDTVTKT